METDAPIKIVSSMATRRLLAELIARFEATSPLRTSLESVGGVDAAKRVRAGEPFDLVVLASNAIDDLIAEGHLVAGSRVDVVSSGVAIAVPAGTAHPDIGSVDALKRAVLTARSIGYSTGPSGVHLAKLFATWDPAGALGDRIVVAPPGVPVASLVARGEVALGFQQRSEMLSVEGIDVVGMLPAGAQVVTTFSGGIARAAVHADQARALLQFMAAPEVADIKRQNGMDVP
jgi:molybdate transport system substrate-binding protein